MVCLKTAVNSSVDITLVLTEIKLNLCDRTSYNQVKARDKKRGLREGSTKAISQPSLEGSGRLQEGYICPKWALVAFAEPSRSPDLPSPPSLPGAFLEPSRSLPGAFPEPSRSLQLLGLAKNIKYLPLFSPFSPNSISTLTLPIPSPLQTPLPLHIPLAPLPNPILALRNLTSNEPDAPWEN